MSVTMGDAVLSVDVCRSSGVGAPLTRHSLKRCTTAAGSLAAMTASSNMQVPIVVSASDAMITTGDFDHEPNNGLLSRG